MKSHSKYADAALLLIIALALVALMLPVFAISGDYGMSSGVSPTPSSNGASAELGNPASSGTATPAPTATPCPPGQVPATGTVTEGCWNA